jgi:hypothetical protein
MDGQGLVADGTNVGELINVRLLVSATKTSDSSAQLGLDIRKSHLAQMDTPLSALSAGYRLSIRGRHHVMTNSNRTLIDSCYECGW